ncbi:MAG: hypothetical protein WB992_01515 [Bryobacteraceae bacterium]
MRKITLPPFFIALLAATSFSLHAQDAAAIQQKLVSEYALTQPNGANDDIVTAGAVLVLKKGPLIMGAASNSINPYHSTYKDGKIKNPAGAGKGLLDRARGIPGMSSLPGSNAPGTRTFVPGEKVWVTKIDVKDDGVTFGLFTDAYKDASGNDVRYKSDLKFPFPKGWTPTSEQVEKIVAEVFTVQPADDAKTDSKDSKGAAGGQQAQPASGQPQATQAAAAPAEAPPPPIAPPPPPPADPKTIALKQTKDEVIANFGQPDKIIKLGAKEIYVYKDMKVTFTGGKVSDVQ